MKRKTAANDASNERKKTRQNEKILELSREFLESCEENNLSKVTFCLFRDVDVNSVSEDGRWSGLTIAAHKNYPELLEILLSHPGIEINKTSVYIVRLDINYQTEDGNTAAHVASMNGHTECVRILAETGRVDWNKRNKQGRTPLYLALKGGFSDIVDIIVQQPNIDYNVQTEDGETLGHAAVYGGNVKCVETLAAQKSFDSWNVPNRWGETPIKKALSYHGQTECVRILAETGRVDWNKRNKEGETPLFWALWGGHSDIVDIIVQQPDIDYNVKTKDGETLGHAAVRNWRGNVKCVETLAAQESFDSWNVPDWNGDTPLMIAIKVDKILQAMSILTLCPRVDLDVVDAGKKNLEQMTQRKLIKDQLWSFRSVQQRMILRDSLLTRKLFDSVSSLQSLSRDAVLLILSTNNSQERLVTPLVDRLGQNITKQAREILLTSYSERKEAGI